MKKGLGKGLGALFNDNEIQNLDYENASDDVKFLKISQVEPNPAQPRKNFDKEGLEELAESIKEYGIISPILVKKEQNGFHMIIAGERRWRAARMAGIKEIPVVIKDLDERESAKIALVENLQREDLNPAEEAVGYKTLMQEYELTQEDVAKSVSKSRSAVANALRLLSLDQEIIEMIRSKELSAGHARAILPLGQNAVEAAKKIIKEGLSVRQTEALVKSMSSGKEKNLKKEKDYLIADIEQKLCERLQRKVLISGGNKKGKIEIEYYSQEDLNDLLEYLQK